MKFVSPKDMLSEAKKQMIENREPETQKDWILIFNFFAANVAKEVQPSALFLINRIYGDPLTDETITRISEYQIERMEEGR